MAPRLSSGVCRGRIPRRLESTGPAAVAASPDNWARMASAVRLSRTSHWRPPARRRVGESLTTLLLSDPSYIEEGRLSSNRLHIAWSSVRRSQFLCRAGIRGAVSCRDLSEPMQLHCEPHHHWPGPAGLSIRTSLFQSRSSSISSSGVESTSARPLPSNRPSTTCLSKRCLYR